MKQTAVEFLLKSLAEKFENEMQSIYSKDMNLVARICIEAKEIEMQQQDEFAIRFAEWSNGEGYDISFDTNNENTKSISLHTDEIDTMLSCLNHLNYFN
jgi:prephenate dehydrogenase